MRCRGLYGFVVHIVYCGIYTHTYIQPDIVAVCVSCAWYAGLHVHIPRNSVICFDQTVARASQPTMWGGGSVHQSAKRCDNNHYHPALKRLLACWLDRAVRVMCVCLCVVRPIFPIRPSGQNKCVRVRRFVVVRRSVCDFFWRERGIAEWQNGAKGHQHSAPNALNAWSHTINNMPVFYCR